MKSKLFESLNDRSNIINAYNKMVSESIGEVADKTAEADIDNPFAPPSEFAHPVAVYDENYNDSWIDLDDFEYEHMKKSTECENGSDDFYFNLAFEQLGTDGVYEKLKEGDYVPSPNEIDRGGVTNSKSDLYSEIVEIGKTIKDDLHKDDIEVAVPNWALSYLVNNDDSSLSEEEKDMIDDWELGFIREGYYFVYDGEELGFRNHPSFGLASDCTKCYFVKNENSAIKTNVGESSEEIENTEENKNEDGFFDKNGFLVKEIPEEAILQCSAAGRDCYEDCKEWVNKLGFDKGLDLEKVKTHLLHTGGWTKEELDTEPVIETAIKLLWDVCCTLKENGMDSSVIYLGESEECSKDGCKNDSVKEPTLKDMQKINPNIRKIEEDDIEQTSDGEYDENGIYHEYPKTDNKINAYRQKFRIHPDGTSKFDDLAEELHTALDGCTKGFFTDDQYSVVQEVMNKLEQIGLFTTITKVENTGIRQSDGLRSGKKYHFDATWTNKFGKKMIVHGIVSIFFAGTTEDPEQKYDACVHFFTDDGNYIRVDC